MKTSLTYGIVANSKTRVRCIFCGVYIPKAAKCIEQHTNGSKHKENIELMAENGIRYKDGLYCKLCNLEIDDDKSAKEHIVENLEHNNWIGAMQDLVDGEFVDLEAFLGSDENYVHCEVCNLKLNCTFQTVQAHIKSIEHIAKLAYHLKPLNGIFNVDNDEELWCKICDEYIENTVEGIMEHIDDDQQHIDWFIELQDIIEGHDFSLEQYLTNEFENNVNCKRCQKSIVCNMDIIESHVNSIEHLDHFTL